MSGKDSNIQPGRRKLGKVEEEKFNTRPDEYHGLKKEVNRGYKKFWEKRNTKIKTEFSYGKKKK